MKHLKKNDGYVVVYVLIAFTILSLVAVSICSVALDNLQAQKASVARMEARYQAEGYLQQFIAQIENVEAEGTAATKDDSIVAMRGNFLIKTKQMVEASAELQEHLTITNASTPELLSVEITSEDGSAQIRAKLQITLTSSTVGDEESRVPDTDPPEYTQYVCRANAVEVTSYQAYDISYQTVPAPDDGGGDGT